MFKHMQSIWSLAVAAVVLMVVPARVQAQTPENTVITNTATATYTDGNGNTYDPVPASVSVTVGFLPGVNVTANTPTQQPASPSSANTLTFTVQNTGNGTDSLAISETISASAVMTVTGYRYAATTYATLADLNAVLSGAAIAQGGSFTIDVLYNVPTNQGGVNTIYTLTAASRRAPTPTSDNDQSSITPQQTYCIGDCGTGNPPPPGGGGGDQINIGFGSDSILNVFKLPGTNYTVTYYFVNGGNGTDSFDLLASSPGAAVITIVSVDGVSGDSTRITLAAATGKYVTVVYNVADVAAGSQDSLRLRVRSAGDPSIWHDGILALTVVKPSLTLTKQAFRDDGTTPINNTTDRVIPGEYIRYRMTVTNTGSTEAKTVQVTDSLPADVTYDSASGAGWSITVNPGQNISALWNAGGPLAASASGTFELRVRVN